MSSPQYYQVVLPPDPEWLAQIFLSPILSPTPVATRLPPPADLQASLQGFVRVEAGDVSPCMDVWGAAYDMTFLMHSYSPNEMQAAQHSQVAIGNAMAATGITVSGWYIVKVVSVIGGRRLDDPDVPLNIVRYRSAVTWRVAGQLP